MSGKPKFKPVITRVELNPEQAVLSCSCPNNNFYNATNGPRAARFTCYIANRGQASTTAYSPVSSNT